MEKLSMKLKLSASLLVFSLQYIMFTLRLINYCLEKNQARSFYNT